MKKKKRKLSAVHRQVGMFHFIIIKVILSHSLQSSFCDLQVSNFFCFFFRIFPYFFF